MTIFQIILISIHTHLLLIIIGENYKFTLEINLYIIFKLDLDVIILL